MKRLNILGTIVIVAIVGVIIILSFPSKPSVEVSAEANATSTVVIPNRPSVEPVEQNVEPIAGQPVKEVYIYNTIKEVTKDDQQATNETAEVEPKPDQSITFVPTPVYSTPTVIVNPTPITVTPIIVSSIEPIEPVQEPVSEPVEPVIEKDHFIGTPSFEDIKYNDGIRAFLNADWTGNSQGSIICNDIYQYKGTIKQGWGNAVISYKNMVDQFGHGVFVHCRFSVPDVGSLDYTLTTP